MLDTRVQLERCTSMFSNSPLSNSHKNGKENRSSMLQEEVVGLERGPLSLVSAIDRLCGLVVRVPGYRSRDPGSIPDATRVSK
jgi:hypothetical protein